MYETDRQEEKKIDSYIDEEREIQRMKEMERTKEIKRERASET